VGGIRVLVAVTTGFKFHGTCTMEYFCMYFATVMENSQGVDPSEHFLFLVISSVNLIMHYIQ
jgi:hypothetical protein